MMVLRHICVVVWSALRMGVTTRNLGVVLAVVLGLLIIAAATAAHTAAPFVLYPFA